MKENILNWFTITLETLSSSNQRIIWNLFLAFIPLILSILLFRKSPDRLRSTTVGRSPLWWLGFLIFLAFLPNAPYVLTDSIHLLEFIDRNYPTSIIMGAIVPQYFLFIFAGFEAYVISLMCLHDYLEKQGQKQYIIASELVLHFLCAIGIYLGRFERFNSWDFITQPLTLVKTIFHSLIDPWHIAAIAICFIILVPLYRTIERVNLSFISRIKTNTQF
ncbi:MAG: DUF1361 domain-containing protein [Xenococcaceae cyanobacterium]